MTETNNTLPSPQRLEDSFHKIEERVQIFLNYMALAWWKKSSTRKNFELLVSDFWG